MSELDAPDRIAGGTAGWSEGTPARLQNEEDALATKIEQAMNERRGQAEAEARREYPGCRDITVAFFGTEVTVEVKDKDGHWRRFRHHVDEDIVAAEIAEQSVKHRGVVHGERVA